MYVVWGLCRLWIHRLFIIILFVPLLIQFLFVKRIVVTTMYHFDILSKMKDNRTDISFLNSKYIYNFTNMDCHALSTLSFKLLTITVILLVVQSNAFEKFLCSHFVEYKMCASSVGPFCALNYVRLLFRGCSFLK